MILFYRLISIPFILLSLPYFLKRMVKRGGYLKDFRHRLGFFPILPQKEKGVKRIWLQAVSVGEVLAIEPIIKELNQMQDIEIVLTTTTSTGYREALKKYSNSVLKVGLFPIDFLPFSLLSWKKISPDIIILTESEMWPEHLNHAKKYKIPTFLINARLSKKSFKRLHVFKVFSKWVISKIDYIYPSTKSDNKLFRNLGATPQGEIGNIKLDVGFKKIPTKLEKETRLEKIGFIKNDTKMFILLGSSTWAKEEEMLLNIQKDLINKNIDCRLLLVPRHEERRKEIINILNQQKLNWDYATSQNDINRELKIYLSDTTGNLKDLTALADVAFIGKSMYHNQGGQTPIEAASQLVPSIFGPNMTNFLDIKDELLEVGAALEIKTEEELFDSILKVASDEEFKKSMHEACQTWVHNNNNISNIISKEIIKLSLDLP